MAWVCAAAPVAIVFALLANSAIWHWMQKTLGLSRSWHDRSGKLSVTLDVLDLLPNGTIPLPEGTQEVFIEVGANSVDTVDSGELGLFPSAFLVSFEPLVHQYATLLSRKSRADELQALGQHHDRGVVLPLAVSNEDGFAQLRIEGTRDACASLLPAKRHLFEDGKCASVDKPAEMRTVPTVSLQTVLGTWLAWEDGTGWPVSYLKIDAQGLDLDIVRSAGHYLSRVRRVVMETTSDSCDQMYHGSPRCTDIVDAMTGLGFVVAHNQSCFDFATRCTPDREVDFEFLRPGMSPFLDKLPWGDECWVGWSEHRDPCCSDTRFYESCFDTNYRYRRCCPKDTWTRQ